MAFLKTFAVIPFAEYELPSQTCRVRLAASTFSCASRSRIDHTPSKCLPARLYAILLLALLSAVGSSTAAQPSSATCPRFAAGATVSNPPELRSHDGILELSLHLKYQQTLSGEGPPRYCYVTDDGLESPTLRVSPGDQLILHLHNDLSPWRDVRLPAPEAHTMSQEDDCAGGKMDPSFTNLHFHGMTIPPVCHQDEVIRTAIPAGQEFDYRVTIPGDEPPGLYWYHPHPHGFSERQVQGGASGAIIVEGIRKAVPLVKSMPERVILLRDQQRIGPEPNTPFVPAWDISANFVPITYSGGQPAVLKTRPGDRELWRVVNAGADVIFNLQLLINKDAQPIQLVAVDGVPVSATKPLPSQGSVFLPPGARAEFIVTTPKEGEKAELITQAWGTGPQGDNDTKRTIADIVSTTSSEGDDSVYLPSRPLRWSAQQKLPPAAIHRRLYFSQQASNSQDPDNFVLYFVTVVGQAAQVYKMGSPPNIVVHRGDVEDWTVENRSPEDHVFHIHQIHFRVVEVDGKPVDDPTMRDTVDVPYWNGEGPYHSVRLRMDFRDPNTVGTFLYHCHILKHEDMGMMGSIKVLPTGLPTKVTLSSLPRSVSAGDAVTVRAAVAPEHATGAVQFTVDGYDVGRPAELSNGQASFVTSFGDAGRHTISAIYFGDSSYDESAARNLDIQVRQ
jgi:FtsP/CotA-like multicopper oxidase with cupredoxin domain